MTADDLEVIRLGAGPRVVFVHGSIVGAERTWRAQLELAARWSLVLPNRPGFGDSPPLERGDFEAEAPLVAELLEDGAHLVGHSYGAVIALHAAALRPEAVRSLTISEPGCLRVTPEAAAMLAHGEQLYRVGTDLSPRDFLLAFRGGVNSSHPTPDVLPDWLERGARHVQSERPPWDGDTPLAPAPHPVLVLSGGHSPAFEAVCDVVAERLGGERDVLPGRGHTIPGLGAPYNDRLEAFLAQAVEQA